MKINIILISTLIFINACSTDSSHQQKTQTIKTMVSVEKNISPTGLSEKEQLAILKYHNKIRAKVNLNALVWSNKIAEYAKKWVSNLANNGCKLQHSSDSNYGENLFMGTYGYYTVIDGIKSWEKEKVDYSGMALNSANWRKIGHYTQMVWHNTTELGCAKTVCNHNLIMVCNYSPAGNYMGQKPY
jgi:pathogenesis-related protein 1